MTLEQKTRTSFMMSAAVQRLWTMKSKIQHSSPSAKLENYMLAKSTRLVLWPFFSGQPN